MTRETDQLTLFVSRNVVGDEFFELCFVSAYSRVSKIQSVFYLKVCEHRKVDQNTCTVQTSEGWMKKQMLRFALTVDKVSSGHAYNRLIVVVCCQQDTFSEDAISTGYKAFARPRNLHIEKRPDSF